MACFRCIERGRRALRNQGYELGADGIWRHPNGRTVNDADIQGNVTKEFAKRPSTWGAAAKEIAKDLRKGKL